MVSDHNTAVVPSTSIIPENDTGTDFDRYIMIFWIQSPASDLMWYRALVLVLQGCRSDGLGGFWAIATKITQPGDEDGSGNRALSLNLVLLSRASWPLSAGGCGASKGLAMEGRAGMGGLAGLCIVVADLDI